MKPAVPALFFAILFSITSHSQAESSSGGATVVGQPELEATTSGITYVDGIFFPTHAISGMVYDPETQNFYPPEDGSDGGSGGDWGSSGGSSFGSGFGSGFGSSVWTHPWGSANWSADVTYMMTELNGAEKAALFAEMDAASQEQLVRAMYWMGDDSLRDFLTSLPNGQAGPALNYLPDIRRLNLSGLDLTGLVTVGRELNGVDFSGSNITSEQIFAVPSYNRQRIKLAGVDLSSWQMAGQDLSNINFSGSNITGAQLNAASYIWYSDLSGVDLTGFSAQGKMINSINFAGSNITGAQLNGSSWMTGANLSGLDLTGWSGGGDLHAVNFSGSNVTLEQLVNAQRMPSIILSGTGITREALEAALIEAGKNLSDPNFDLNSMTF